MVSPDNGILKLQLNTLDLQVITKYRKKGNNLSKSENTLFYFGQKIQITQILHQFIKNIFRIINNNIVIN